MNISRLFILRPVATTLSMLAIVLAGLIAYRLLPVSALPQVEAAGSLFEHGRKPRTHPA